MGQRRYIPARTASGMVPILRINIGMKPFKSFIEQAQELLDKEVDEIAPPGWEGTVRHMKKHKEIDNPYAPAWSMKKKGFKSHIKPKK